jgi:hypothetical protein
MSSAGRRARLHLPFTCSGLGPEKGHEGVARQDSDDHELVSFMVQELQDAILTMKRCVYLLRKGHLHSA